MDMEIVKELFIVLLRIMTIMPLTLFLALYMGKRSIGELPVFDFIVVVVLGSVVGADIADPDISHIHTVVAIIAIALLQKVVSKWLIRNRKAGKALTFEPTIVMKDQKFLHHNMKKIQFSVDNVLQMLREKDVFDIGEVKIAIVEANGRLTVQTYTANNNFFYPVILDGVVSEKALLSVGESTEWLLQELLNMGVLNVEEVFYAGVSIDKEIRVSLKKSIQSDVVNLEH